MATSIFDFTNNQDWQLAATGVATVILSSLNGTGHFFHMASNTKPSVQFGHPISSGESLTFNVKTGEFLFVRVDNVNTRIAVTV